MEDKRTLTQKEHGIVWPRICARGPGSGWAAGLAGRRNVGARRRKIQASDLQGFKYFQLIPELLETLREVGTERDEAGNRDFFCDHYLSLLLL